MSSVDSEVAPIEVNGQQIYGDRPFPLVLKNSTPTSLESMSSWLSAHAEQLLQQASEHGAILFRGFPLKTANDFDTFVAAFDLPNFPYRDSLSNAVRVNRTERVFTANEAPPSVNIFLHHEMAQTPIYPSRLFFFCEQAAETGGATPLCRSDILWERLQQEHPQFAADCLSKGLLYSNVMPDSDDAQSGMGRSWRSTLKASTREEAEDRLRGYGYSWTWLEDGCLRATTPVLPAVRRLPDGRHTFFNQLIAAYQGWKDVRNDPSKSITHGDGTPLDSQGAQAAARLGEELSFDTPWETGDVALVDNFVAMHGRRTFTGTRKVLASLIAHEAN